ncbi:MAG: hypothetical protein ACOX4Z_03050 [Desulfobulbus sp.]|jgi:hypothetical protein
MPLESDRYQAVIAQQGIAKPFAGSQINIHTNLRSRLQVALDTVQRPQSL